MSIELANDTTARGAASPGRLLSRKAANLRARLARGLVADSVQIGFRRQAIRPQEVPAAPFPISVRAMTDEDVAALLPADTSGMSREDEAEIAMRRELVRHLPGCGHVVVDDTTGKVCLLQWFAGHAHNDGIARLEGLPPLEPHQVLAEGLFVPRDYRGQRIATAAAMLLLAQATRPDVDEIVTFIGETNTPSVRAALRAGFSPYMMHVRRHYLFGLFERDRFSALPADHPLLAAKS